MPSNPLALAALRDRRFHPLPAVKTMDAPELHSLIRRSTGIPFEPKVPPQLPQRLHQLRGVAAALYQPDGCLLFYQVRLGKTKIALDWADHLRRAGMWRGMGVIIAHAPSGLDVWETESRKFSDLRLRVVRTKPDDLIAAVEEAPDFIVMTWAHMVYTLTMKRKPRKGAKRKLTIDPDICDVLADLFEMVIIDEIHKAKNFSSLNFTMADAITRKSRFRLGLTGTPLNRDPFAAWSQFYLMDHGRRLGSNFMFFREAFGRKSTIARFDRAAMRRADVNVTNFDPKYLPIMEQQFRSISVTYERSEVEADDIIRGSTVLRMKGDQLKAYQQLLRDKMDENSSDEPMPWVRFKQITSGFFPFVDEFGIKRVARFDSNAKLEWLLDELPEFPEDASIIVFYEFIETGDMLAEAFKEAGISFGRIDGRTRDRETVRKRFQDRTYRILQANYDSGGTGIDLNAADYVLFYEPPSAAITRTQAEGRPMAERHGRPIFIDDIIASATDRRCLELVAEGQDLHQSVVVGRNLWDELCEDAGISRKRGRRS